MKTQQRHTENLSLTIIIMAGSLIYYYNYFNIFVYNYFGRVIRVLIRVLIVLFYCQAAGTFNMSIRLFIW